MGRFEAVNGLIHMTFANEDKYYKNSLVCLNLRQNLYYELQQKDYEAVCFVKFENDKFQIKFGNDRAATLYDQSSGKVISKFLKSFISTDSVNVPKALEYDKESDEFLDRIINMMKREKQIAVVFTMEAFAALQNIRKAEQGFLEISQNNYNKNNLLLIVAPTAVDGSRVHFENPNGIFRTSLFPAINNIFENYENVHLYERMKLDMPNRISYLNVLDVDEIKNLVSYTIMKEDLDLSFTARDYADCIWYIYNSVTFYNWVNETFCIREDFKFPSNPRREYSKLEKLLKDEAVYRILDNVILKIHELTNSSDRLYKVIPNAMKLRDFNEDDQQYLFWNNDILQRIEMISCGWLRVDEIKKEAQSKLAKIRRSLNAPYICSNKGEDNIRETYMGEYIDDALEAKTKKDQETFLTAIEAMHYIVCVCEEDTQKNADRELEIDKNNIKKTSMICYRKILDCQKNVFELKKDITKDERSFVSENQERAKILNEIKQMEIEYPEIKKLEQVYLDDPDGKKEKPLILTKYLEKKIAVRNKNKNLKGKKVVIATKQSEVNNMESAIRSMETTISGLGLSKGKSIHDDLDHTLEYIQSVFKKVNSMQKDWMKLDAIFDETYEELKEPTDYHLLNDYEFDEAIKEFELDEEFYSKMF